MASHYNSTYPLKVIGENLYEILAEYPSDSVKDISGIKEWLGCDIAFKNNTSQTYVFCKKVEDANIIENNSNS